MWDAAEPTAEGCPSAVLGIVEGPGFTHRRPALLLPSDFGHFTSLNLRSCICKMGLITPPTSRGG